MTEKLPPQCFVYTDGSGDSTQAIELLSKANIRFEELTAQPDHIKNWQAEGGRFPYLISREGDFMGLGDPEVDARTINAFIDLVSNRPA